MYIFPKNNFPNNIRNVAARKIAHLGSWENILEKLRLGKIAFGKLPNTYIYKVTHKG